MKELTCPYCGITNKHVYKRWQYIMGRGLIQITACADLNECGERVRQTKPLKCHWCNHKGYDVNYHSAYLGGQGDVWVRECDDKSACLERRNACPAKPKPELAGIK